MYGSKTDIIVSMNTTKLVVIMDAHVKLDSKTQQILFVAINIE
jgi:hypothetical protein